MAHLPGYIDNLITCDVPAMFDVLLLPGPGWLLESLDDQGRGRRHHLHLHLSVLGGQFHPDLQALLVITCGLGDVITHLL